MRTIIALSLLLASLVATHAGDVVNISGRMDGNKLEVAADVQTNLIVGATRLLASCSNVVVPPKNTLNNARRHSHLELVFTTPRKFDLGFEKRAGTVGVDVKDMVITLPVCSGGIWIESTQFR